MRPTPHIFRSPEILDAEGGSPARADKLTMLIRQAVDEKASDIHLRAGSPPRLRIDGELFQIKGLVPEDAAMRAFFYQMLREDQVRLFERTLELDFSRDIAGVCRVRVNLYMERSAFCAALRLVPRRIPTMEEIQLPPACERLTRLTRGLVLVTGPTGSGKSTTLAAMLDHVNASRRCHILTIEDPIEYHYEDRRALVSQRELDLDTKTFTAALRHSFRQDPDVVLLGEMRDPETMATAITLAETGHLTFSTLHPSDCTQTITRIVDAFPPYQQEQIRSQLALSLEAVISQRLLKLKGRKGRVAAREVMICTRAIRNLIREGKYNQIYSAIQTGVEEGMITLDAALAQLLHEGAIDYETALETASDPKEFAMKFAGMR
jgi:twitching motility protein PilT